MSALSLFRRALAIAAVTLFLAGVQTTALRAQDDEVGASPSAADIAAARGAQNVRRHPVAPRVSHAASQEASAVLGVGLAPNAAAAAEDAPPPPFLIRYPADMVYQGGPTVQFAESHAVYMLPNGTAPFPSAGATRRAFCGT